MFDLARDYCCSSGVRSLWAEGVVAADLRVVLLGRSSALMVLAGEAVALMSRTGIVIARAVEDGRTLFT